MKVVAVLPFDLGQQLSGHLLQGDLEQGAFLFATSTFLDDDLILTADRVYRVPPDGWEVQTQDYLQLKDTERAKIMKFARDGGYALIDCHSHPASDSDVTFSCSDRSGITEFAAYAKWKLDGKPYIAMVWGESSVDAVAWYGNFAAAMPVAEVRVAGDRPRVFVPRGTWHHRPRLSPRERSRWRRTDMLVRYLRLGKKDKGR